MHGRPRVTVKAEGSAAGQQKAAESNKKALRLRALQEKVLTWHQQNVYSPEALAASAALLEQNPDVYVTWNYRKKAFLADEELKLIEAALRTNPKCYGAWHHRKWLFALSATEPLPSLGASLGPNLQQVRINLRTEARIAREQKLLGMMLSADDRNFHAWDYWRFISHVARMSPAKDLAFTMERINANFSNYSAWHSRSKLLLKLHARSPPTPTDSEAGGLPHPRPFLPSLLSLPFPFSFSPAPHSKLLPKLHSSQAPSEAGGLPQAALEEECELVRQAFFTEPDDQSGWMYQHWLLQQILPPLPPHLLASWPSPGSTVCFSSPENPPEISPGGDSAAVEGVSEASAGAAGQVRMSAVLVFSEPVVGVTRESVTLTGAGLEVGEWKAVGGQEAWLSGRQAGASGAAGGGEQWRVDVVQREIDMCRELIDLEPDSKWALLSLARLLSTRRQLHHLLPNLPVQARQDAEACKEVRSLLRRLVGIDPYHKEYYRDLLEALEGEEVCRVCE
ncbi:unnamed protein product [Closterium sp. Yama58-4]|nr:unnamed protein product [Closterium sp. Yama58-4]